MTRAITLLVQQSSGILDKVAPQIKEEAYKKVAQIKSKIPTEASIKQRVMDEITSKGPELVCSIEARNSIDKIYNKLKSLIEKLQNTANKSNEKLLQIQEQLQKVQSIIAIIEGIFAAMRILLPILNIAVQVAKIGLMGLVGLASSGAATVKFKDIIDKSKSKVEEIKNSIKVYEKKLKKIRKKVFKISNILTKMIGIITLLNASLVGALGIVESFYLKYTLMCDVEGDSMEDEDYANAVNNSLNNLNNASGFNNASNLNDILGGNGEIVLIEDDLLPNTIERIRNAKFEVIQYRIA